MRSCHRTGGELQHSLRTFRFLNETFQETFESQAILTTSNKKKARITIIIIMTIRGRKKIIQRRDIRFGGKELGCKVCGTEKWLRGFIGEDILPSCATTSQGRGSTRVFARYLDALSSDGTNDGSFPPKRSR